MVSLLSFSYTCITRCFLGNEACCAICIINLFTGQKLLNQIQICQVCCRLSREWSFKFSLNLTNAQVLESEWKVFSGDKHILFSQLKIFAKLFYSQYTNVSTSINLLCVLLLLNILLWWLNIWLCWSTFLLSDKHIHYSHPLIRYCFNKMSQILG